MKRSEELQEQLKTLEELKERKYYEMVGCRLNPTQEGYETAWKEYYEKCGKRLCREIDDLKFEIQKEQRREVEVGDGVTLCLYTDREACTVIAKTKTTITVQRDKAILNPNFKPEYIVGGFCAHCTNQYEQGYTYERDPNGEITKCYWSERLGRYTTGGDQSIKVMLGRHEFYDYNF